MTKKQKFVLWAAILASFVAFLDAAVVNVALPAIADELGGGLASQQWVVDAYLITLGSLILIAGSVSDLFGRKRVLTAGLLGFAVTSVLCAIAPTDEFLIVMRGLQGAAGALIVPSSLAIIISNFKGAAQGKAIGKWTAWTGIAFVIGPLVGGWLVDAASWRWVFAINVLPIAVTLWLMTYIKRDRVASKKVRIDYRGAVLGALGLGGPVFALIEYSRLGWDHPAIYLALIIGLAMLVGFFWHERKTKQPMLPLSLFKNHNFSVGNLATLAIYAALTASSFLIVVFVQQVGGYSALASGMTLIPVTLLLFLLSSRVGALSGKYGPRWFMAGGPLLAALGFLLLLGTDSHINYFSDLLPGLIVFGIGLAITVTPLVSAILGDVDNKHAGIASAVNNAIARVAGLIAVAAIGAVVATSFGASINNAQSQQHLSEAARSALEASKSAPLVLAAPQNLSAADQRAHTEVVTAASVSAYRTGLAIIAGLLALGGVISALGIQNHKEQT